MGIIYCYTNNITGKKYIGQTIHPERRKACHLHEATKGNSEYYFHRSIRKHGWDSFSYEVLEETENLSERETFYIRSYNTLWPNGYNQLEEHNAMPEEVKKKISETKKKQYASKTDEEKKQYADARRGPNGKKHSEESKKKRSESLKKYYSEHKRVMSEETKIKIKDSMRKVRKEKFWTTKKQGP